MSIEVQQISIIRRLLDRLKLKGSLSPPLLRFGTWVIPITNVDELLRVPAIKTVSGMAVSGSGLLAVYTVPAGKRWLLYAGVINKITGAFTFDGIAVAGPTGTEVLVKSQSSASPIRWYPADGYPMPLDQLWRLQVNVAPFTTEGTLDAAIYIEEEDAY